MPKTYYNTVGLFGERLRLKIQAAGKQEKAIQFIYEELRMPLSPSQVLAIMQEMGMQPPITSVRRAITNLTDRGLLIKSPKTVEGLYGDPEHQWLLKEKVYPIGEQAKLF